MERPLSYREPPLCVTPILVQNSSWFSPRRLRISRGLMSSSSFMVRSSTAQKLAMPMPTAWTVPGLEKALRRGSADPYVSTEFTIKFKHFFRGRDGADRSKIRRDFGGHDRAHQKCRR